jgi:hypothetical protein
VVIRQEGELPSFDFEPLDHVALIEKNDWADLARITQVSGSRTYCLKGRLALLEQVLMVWAMERLSASGFTLMTVPALARPQAFVGTGHFPGHEEEAYHLPADDLYLAGTGEIALTGLHSGEILDASQLPILYAGYSPCFRREAGSAGRDVRGLLRVHQFLKVEQYVICRDDPEESARWHQQLLAQAETLLRELEIPYQVIETSTGDMGAGKFRMNDIESWVPSLGKYRETHSCSTLHDWQARRANLRWRDEDRKVRFAHTLNNTALALPASSCRCWKTTRLPTAASPAQGAAGADGERISVSEAGADGAARSRSLLPHRAGCAAAPALKKLPAAARAITSRRPRRSRCAKSPHGATCAGRRCACPRSPRPAIPAASARRSWSCPASSPATCRPSRSVRR